MELGDSSWVWIISFKNWWQKALMEAWLEGDTSLHSCMYTCCHIVMLALNLNNFHVAVFQSSFFFHGLHAHEHRLSYIF